MNPVSQLVLSAIESPKAPTFLIMKITIHITGELTGDPIPEDIIRKEVFRQSRWNNGVQHLRGPWPASGPRPIGTLTTTVNHVEIDFTQ